MESLQALIESWDGEGVVARHDEPTGTWIFIALHDSTLGRAETIHHNQAPPRP